MLRVTMTSHVMDISQVLREHVVTWLTSKEEPADGPDNALLYSLIAGKNELCMFGGIQKDTLSRNANQGGTSTAPVFNSVHILSAKRTII